MSMQNFPNFKEQCMICWNDICELKTCGNCKRAKYCSVKCQKEDWKLGHKLICKLTLSEVLKYTVSHHQQQKSWILNEIYLSSNNIFDKTHLFPFLMCNFCAVCGNIVQYKGPLMHVMVTFRLGRHCVIYYRCNSCQMNNERICQVTFQNVKTCFSQKMVVFISSVTREMWLPSDIVKLIVRLCYGMKCCSC